MRLAQQHATGRVLDDVARVVGNREPEVAVEQIAKDLGCTCLPSACVADVRVLVADVLGVRNISQRSSDLLRIVRAASEITRVGTRCGQSMAGWGQGVARPSEQRDDDCGSGRRS